MTAWAPVIPPSGVASMPEATPVAPATPAPVPAAARGPRPASWALGIAAVLAIAVLGGWNLVLQGQLSDAQAYEAHMGMVLDLAAEPGAQTVVLASDGDGPTGLAVLGPNGEMAMAMQSMPATSGTQVYEAWAIAGDAAPVPLGSFQVGNDGTGTFAMDDLDAEPGVVLAVTLEPGPGATAPTGPIVASGASSSG
jgi:anti-sigma-K factor RskA